MTKRYTNISGEAFLLKKNNYKMSVRIKKEDWQKFKSNTESLGLSASDVIRLFINKFNENPDNLKKILG